MVQGVVRHPCWSDPVDDDQNCQVDQRQKDPMVSLIGVEGWFAAIAVHEPGDAADLSLGFGGFFSGAQRKKRGGAGRMSK